MSSGTSCTRGWDSVSMPEQQLFVTDIIARGNDRSVGRRTEMPDEPSSDVLAMSGLVFTVGHSNVHLVDLLRLLNQNEIAVVADVRSQPASRFASDFNRPVLERSLPKAGIGYLFLGQELGGRPDDPSCYDEHGHVLYGRQAKTATFRAGIERLERVAHQGRTSIMCSEEDPAGCHRHLIVARVLASRGWRVEHMRGDGRLQPYDSMADVLSRDHAQVRFDLGDEGEDLTWRSVRSVSRDEARQNSSAH
jgi:Domain of unknown function DUF488